MDYNDEALKLLSIVLRNIIKGRDGDPKTTGIRSHPSGVYCLEVNGVPEEWFYDEIDLAQWLVKEYNERVNNKA